MKRLRNILVEVAEKDSDFMSILDVVKGRKNPSTVFFDDDWIDKIDKDYIYFHFDNEEDFFNTLYGDQYDEYEVVDIKWLYYRPYEYEYTDGYQTDEDWKEGYVLNVLNSDNRKNVIDLLKAINANSLNKKLIVKAKENGETDFSSRNLVKYFDGYTEEIAIDFEKSFPKFVDKIKDEYFYAREESFGRGMDRYMSNEFLKDLYSPYKLQRWGSNPFESAKMSLSDLMLLYSYAGTVNDSVGDVLKNYMEKRGYKSLPGNPRESMYEHDDYDFLRQKFNSEFEFEIEKIMSDVEGIEDSADKYKELSQIYSDIQNKYGGFNKGIIVYEDDKSKTEMIIKGVDPEDLKIDLTLYKWKKQGNEWREHKNIKVKKSTLDSLINNYQLFDLFDF